MCEWLLLCSVTGKKKNWLKQELGKGEQYMLENSSMIIRSKCDRDQLILEVSVDNMGKVKELCTVSQVTSSVV